MSVKISIIWKLLTLIMKDDLGKVCLHCMFFIQIMLKNSN